MNHKYYLQVVRKRGPGYFIAIVIIAIIYFFFRDWLFANQYAAPMIAVIIVLSIIFSNILVDYNSFLEVSNGLLSFYKMFQKKWSVSISEISTVEEHLRTVRAIEKVSGQIGGRPRTGVKITSTSGKTYEAEYGDRLVKYKLLVEDLSKINPSIKSISNPELSAWAN